MPDIDFYGYERDHAGSYLYSSDVAAIYFDNNGVGSPTRAGLVQNVQASYQHSVLPRFEAGSSELYWVAGQAQGSVGVGRLVSYGGLLEGIKPGTGQSDLRNGILGSVFVKIGKMSGQLRQVQLPQSQLVMRGCVLQGFSTTFTTGALEVAESMSIQVALMKKSTQGGSSQFGGSGGSGNASNNFGGKGLGGALLGVAENAAFGIGANAIGNIAGGVNVAVDAVSGTIGDAIASTVE